MDTDNTEPAAVQPHVDNTPSSAGTAAGAFGPFTAGQKQTLAVLTIIALAFGAYFLRGYLELIALAGVLTYLFHPLYVRIEKRWNAGAAGALTLLSVLAIVIIPLAGILTMAGIQIKQMIDTIGSWIQKTDMTNLGEQVLSSINALLSKVPFVHVELTAEKIQSAVTGLATNMGDFALSFAKQSVGGIAGGVTAAIIFLYVFLALLGSDGKIVSLVKDLSPLKPEVTDVYLSKIGAMVKATVAGQFVIAAVQGTLAAISIYIGGIHQGFFMFLIFLTVLSIIPLGAGIVTIPLGIGMAATGNVVGGIFVILFHVLITSNADNILRPMLVPRNAYLPPALMLLAVFAGLSMFGFPGIVFGPVVMIIIVTTIDLYRSVLKGAAWQESFDKDTTQPEKKSVWTKLREKFAGKRKPKGTPTTAVTEGKRSD